MVNAIRKQDGLPAVPAWLPPLLVVLLVGIGLGLRSARVGLPDPVPLLLLVVVLSGGSARRAVPWATAACVCVGLLVFPPEAQAMARLPIPGEWTRWFVTAAAALGIAGVMGLVQSGRRRLDEALQSRVQLEAALTEKEVSSLQLREVADRFDFMVRNGSDVFWITRVQPEQVEFVSNAFERIWGLPSKDLLANPRLWVRAIHPEDRERVGHAFEAWVTHRAEAFEEVYRIVRPDGETRWIADHGVRIARGEPGVIRVGGVARDVTAQVQADATRASMEESLQEGERLRSLGVLAGGIAHDFNNLLSGVLTNASLFRMEFPQGSILGQAAEDIEHSARRGADLCRRMLHYSGEGTRCREKVPLNRLVREAINSLGPDALNGTTLVVELDDRLPEIELDLLQVRDLVRSLVMNALEAVEGRPGPRIRVGTSRVNATPAEYPAAYGLPGPTGERLLFRVQDNGAGIAPEVLPHIFEPFYSTKFTGRGLSLAAVHGILRSHRGSIRVRSTLGQGTEMTVLLPLSLGLPKG